MGCWKETLILELQIPVGMGKSYQSLGGGTQFQHSSQSSSFPQPQAGSRNFRKWGLGKKNPLIFYGNCKFPLGWGNPTDLQDIDKGRQQ